MPSFFKGEVAYKEYGNFLDDPIKFPSSLYILVKSQAEKKQISEDSFKFALDGDAMEAATIALEQEIINFTRPSQRAGLRKALAKMRQIGDALTKAGEAKIDEVDVEKEISKAMKTLDETMNNSSGDAPASLESTQPLSLSVSSS